MKIFILVCATLALSKKVLAESFTLIDTIRERKIPIISTLPGSNNKCSATKKCPVVLFSPGYKVGAEHYRFISRAMSQAGYLVLSIEHELQQDPPLATSGNLQITRIENWRRGALTLNYVKEAVALRFPAYDFDRIVLIGHSNGGDISSWLAQDNPGYIKALITLDNRRAKLPRNRNINLLSIRGADFAADDGVIPTSNEQREFKSCIVKISNSRHDDMTDSGPTWLKREISHIIVNFLSGKCPRSYQDKAD